MCIRCFAETNSLLHALMHSFVKGQFSVKHAVVIFYGKQMIVPLFSDVTVISQSIIDSMVVF